jgi:hypothetical protein
MAARCGTGYAVIKKEDTWGSAIASVVFWIVVFGLAVVGIGSAIKYF